MGSLLGKQMKESMDENMQKNQDFMMASQRLQLERQLAMQQMMAEKQMAMQIARARELFTWIAVFDGFATVALIAGFVRTKNPKLLAPTVPLNMIVAYQYDMVYGDKLTRIRKDAEHIIQKERERITMPSGFASFVDVEKYKAAHQKKTDSLL